MNKKEIMRQAVFIVSCIGLALVALALPPEWWARAGNALFDGLLATRQAYELR